VPHAFPDPATPSLFADLGEDSALIVVEPVLPVIRDVEVFPTVVVVVADANTLSHPLALRPAFTVTSVKVPS